MISGSVFRCAFIISVFLFHLDQTNLTVTWESQLSQSQTNRKAWLDVTSGRAHWLSVLASSQEKRSGLQTSAPDPASLCSPLADEHQEFAEAHARSFCSIREFMQWCEEDIAILKTPKDETSTCNGERSAPVFLQKRRPLENGGLNCGVRVLVTGSLHLVGATMSALGCKVEDL